MRYVIHADMPDEAKARLRTALKLMGATQVRICEAKPEAAAKPIRPDTLPTSPEALAVAALFQRQPEQEWSETEISLFRAAIKRKAISISSMENMTRYYKSERAKGTGDHGGLHRRDLTTFLRNIDGENDRALAYSSRKGSHGPGWLPGVTNIVELPPQPVPTPDEQREQDRFAAELAERRARRAR